MFPFRETIRYRLRKIVQILLRPVANFPKEAPFCIKSWRLHRFNCIIFIEFFDEMSVIACPFLSFWSDARLEMQVRPTVLQLLTSIMHLRNFIKIPFDQVDVLLICLHVDARISESQNAELVEGLCHFDALFFPTLLFVQVLFDVDDGYLLVN